MPSTPAPFTPAPPAGAVPPVLTNRRSSHFSREERGAAAWSSSSYDADTGTPQLPVRTLFGVGEERKASRTQRAIFLSLLALAAWAWLPVVRWALSPLPPQPIQPDESAPHVHVFHEARCAGESLLLGAQPADACDRSYPSGEPVKDNAASVLLFGDAGAAGWELRVYGTCRLAEEPANPMLLETVREEGCVDLRYPLFGSVELVRVEAEL